MFEGTRKRIEDFGNRRKDKTGEKIFTGYMHYREFKREEDKKQSGKE